MIQVDRFEQINAAARTALDGESQRIRLDVAHHLQAYAIKTQGHKYRRDAHCGAMQERSATSE